MGYRTFPSGLILYSFMVEKVYKGTIKKEC